MLPTNDGKNNNTKGNVIETTADLVITDMNNSVVNINKIPTYPPKTVKV